MLRLNPNNGSRPVLLGRRNHAGAGEVFCFCFMGEVRASPSAQRQAAPVPPPLSNLRRKKVFQDVALSLPPPAFSVPMSSTSIGRPDSKRPDGTRNEPETRYPKRIRPDQGFPYRRNQGRACRFHHQPSHIMHLVSAYRSRSASGARCSFRVPGLDPEEHRPTLAQVTVDSNGTATLDAALLFRGRRWNHLCRSVIAHAGTLDPKLGAPVPVKVYGVVMTIRRTSAWKRGFFEASRRTQQSAYTASLNFATARRVFGLTATSCPAR